LVANKKRINVEIVAEYINKNQLCLVINQCPENSNELIYSLVNNMGSLISYIDPYKKNHGKKVANIAFKIGKELNLPLSKLNILKEAGLIHDIGLLAIPTQILNKPEKINKPEYEVIKEHPIIGYNIVKKTKLDEEIAKIVLQHHERIDGSGYPEGLKKNRILFEAQILAVADVLEAMTSPRAYRTAKSLATALGELSHNKGVKYNLEVVEACLEMFKKKNILE
jgi:putative nucleotidyltransferase with HDIG domain